MYKRNEHFISGVTLIELIVSIVIIAVCMLGVFGVIQVVSRHLFEPQKLYQAINLADFYRDQLLSVTSSCQSPSEPLTPIVEQWCQHSNTRLQHQVPLDGLGEGYEDWGLQIDSTLTSEHFYVVALEVKQGQRLLIKTQFVKEAL